MNYLTVVYKNDFVVHGLVSFIMLHMFVLHLPVC
jgi:hypothetical protein